MEIQMIHDLPSDVPGKTWKEKNLEMNHSFPLKSLVEFKDSGIRLLVCGHRRDCDGTPLYCLTWDTEWTEEKQNENPYISYMTCGYAEQYLNLIKKEISC